MNKNSIIWQKIDYESKYLSKMLDMTIENYGSNEAIANQSFVEHEYFMNPSGNPIIKLAYDNAKQKLAGQYITIAARVAIMGKEYPAILSLNTLTRAEYRGKKIFSKLAEDVYKKAEMQGKIFCYGAPNPNSHPGFVSKLGFKDIGIMPLFLKVLKPSLIIKNKLHSNILANICYPLDKLFMVSNNKKSSIEIVKIDERNIELMDSFWNEVKNKYPVIFVRDSNYILWRYIKMPNRKYEIYMAFDNGKACGYIIGRITEVAGMQCGMIVDFLLKPNYRDASSALLSHMTECFVTDGASLLGCLMQKNKDEAEYLRKAGFFICPKFFEPQPFPIIFRQFNTTDEDDTINDFSKWFFTMGDYDVI